MPTVPTVAITPTAEIALGDDDILRVRFLPFLEDSLEEARKVTAATAAVARGRRLPMLADLRAMKRQNRAVREYYGSHEATRPLVAIALLVGSRVSTLIANFFITVTGPNVPTRVFADEAEALAWLRSRHG